jgi:CDGSH-type Zn-finger protein
MIHAQDEPTPDPTERLDAKVVGGFLHLRGGSSLTVAKVGQRSSISNASTVAQDGAVAMSASGASAFTITPYRDGPYLVRGSFHLVDQEGNEIPMSRRTIALCRCGKSRMRPFCDGTHRLIGFRAPSTAENDPALLALGSKQAQLAESPTRPACSKSEGHWTDESAAREPS